MKKLNTKTQITTGSDFSGIGAFDQALKRLNIDYKTIFACDMDKYARETYIANYGEPADYPKDVYERTIPKESLDIYMTSPPCQAFSNAGKRLGKLDKRGILFFNSLEFITQNKPRFFIFENVKGLLSHEKSNKKQEFGSTFSEWINYLGGKSVNGNETIFPYEDSVPYHIYFKVLNAKNYGVPQNRERVFIVGIRDDKDNDFSWPKPIVLEKRLKDVLDQNVDEKYFLSDKMLEYFNTCGANFNNGKINYKGPEDVASAISSSSSSLDISDNIIKEPNIKIVGNLEKGGQKGVVYSEDTKTMSCLTATDYKQPKQIEVSENNSPSELILAGNLKGGKWDNINESCTRYYDPKGISPTITTITGGNHHPKVEVDEPQIGAFRGQNPENKNDCAKGAVLQQTLEINSQGISNALTSVNKDNMVILGYTRDEKGNVTSRHEKDCSGTIHTSSGSGGNTDQFVMIPTNNKTGFIKAEEEEDSINLQNPSSKTRRGQVGKSVAQTLDTSCLQGILTKNLSKQEIEKLKSNNVCSVIIPEIVRIRKYEVDIVGLQNLLKSIPKKNIKKIAFELDIPQTKVAHWFRFDSFFSIPDAEYWLKLKEILNITEDKFDKFILTFIKKEGVFEKSNRVYEDRGISPTLTSTSSDERIITSKRIRRLTPKECLRLMDFPEDFKIVVSDSQVYKQAGNSIVVNCLAMIIGNLKKLTNG